MDTSRMVYRTVYVDPDVDAALVAQAVGRAHPKT
jgi:hypothetical protein